MIEIDKHYRSGGFFFENWALNIEQQATALTHISLSYTPRSLRVHLEAVCIVFRAEGTQFESQVNVLQLGAKYLISLFLGWLICENGVVIW